MGPGAPAGPYHHYTFELYALDTKLDVPQGTPQQAADTRTAVVNAMDGHVLGKALLVARVPPITIGQIKDFPTQRDTHIDDALHGVLGLASGLGTGRGGARSFRSDYREGGLMSIPGDGARRGLARGRRACELLKMMEPSKPKSALEPENPPTPVTVAAESVAPLQANRQPGPEGDRAGLRGWQDAPS